MLRILPLEVSKKESCRNEQEWNRGIQLRIRPPTEDVNESRILEFSKFPPISLLERC